MPSAYWNAQLEPFNRGIGNLAQGLMRAPMLRAEAGYMQSRMAEQQQLAQEAAARTGLLGAQQNAITTGDQRIDGASKATAAYMAAQQAYKDNPTPETKKALEDATTNFSGSLATFKNVKVGDLMTALGKAGALNELVGPSPNFATAGGMQGQAASIANNQADNAEKAGRPLNITGALMTPAGQILATAPRNVPQGDVTVGDANTPPMTVLASGTPKQGGAGSSTGSVVVKYPAVDAQPADITPASSGILGFGAHPAVTNSPAIPFQPEHTVTLKIPPGGSIVDALRNVGLNAPAAALPATSGNVQTEQQPPATGAAAPASARTFTDKTGQTFIYTGNLADPSKDQNPNNWQVAK
ncbi:MAG: hypothetical protein KGL39_15590 [Patescibacteria group bacterium]|nr:hypothetical protein [Patescibacteria group bacterium]